MAAEQLVLPFYRVSLEVFEGPLDLLLHLIKKSEVEIADIPVSQITEQYIAYLDLLRDLNLDVAGEFLVMAATLMLIKSRLLLPQSEEEETEEPDPRAELVQQLLEYQRYREAALALSERPMLQRDVFAREAAPDAESLGAAAETPEPVRLRATVWDLMEAFRAVLKRAEPPPVHEVASEQISLRERADTILQRLKVERVASFESMFSSDRTRLQVIVTFLALLELCKMGAVQATQDEGLGTISIELMAEDIDAVHFGALDEYEHVDPATLAAAMDDAPPAVEEAVPSKDED